MRRASIVTVLGALALLAVPVPAQAAPKEPLGPAPDFVGALCGTTVKVSEEVNRAKVGAKGKVTGTLRYRLTDLATGRTALVNASGPGTMTVEPLPGGREAVVFRATGPSLFFPVDAVEAAYFEAAGLPDLLLTSGPLRVSLVLDPAKPETESIVIDAPRRVVDGCALIR